MNGGKHSATVPAGFGLILRMLAGPVARSYLDSLFRAYSGWSSPCDRPFAGGR